MKIAHVGNLVNAAYPIVKYLRRELMQSYLLRINKRKMENMRYLCLLILEIQIPP